MSTTFSKTDTEVANRALLAIGNNELLTDLGADSGATATICRSVYSDTRRVLLQATDWNFATRRAALAEHTSTPAFEFDHMYRLPADCLKVQQLYDADNHTQWKVETELDATVLHSFILTDLAAPLNIKYTADVLVTDQTPPMFIDALASRMAAEIAYPLTKSKTLANSLWNVYRAKSSEGFRRDAQEGTPHYLQDGEWVGVRA